MSKLFYVQAENQANLQEELDDLILFLTAVDNVPADPKLQEEMKKGDRPVFVD